MDSSAVLQSEALGRIMFGNSELFHSNLIAWIFETFPEQADDVFGAFVPRTASSGSDVRTVERERENLDLVMHWPDRGSLVIENKVFAVPTTEQLDRYAAKMAKWKLSIGGAMLLSPTRHQFLDEGYVTGEYTKDGRRIEWRHLSFETLAESLELAFDGLTPAYEVETVLRYCTVLRGLASMMAQATVRDAREDAFLPASLSKSLPKQAVTGLVKARAAHSAAAIRHELALLAIYADGVDSGMSHSLPRLSWFAEVILGDVKLHAGWQYQGGSLSLALILDHLEGKGSAAKLRRAEFARLRPEFFSFDHVDDILGTAGIGVSTSTKKEGPFGHFDPNFIYRYKKADSLTVQQLIDLTVAHAGHLDRLSNAAFGEVK